MGSKQQRAMMKFTRRGNLVFANKNIKITNLVSKTVLSAT